MTAILLPTGVLAGALMVALVIAYYGLPLLYAGVARKRLKVRARRHRATVLTFDDGPGESFTPAVLALLGERGVKASFFLLGRNIAGREHIVRQIAQEGHDLFSHGHNHVDHWKVSPFRAIEDIKAGWRAIDAALEVSAGAYAFRPPHGRLNLASLLYLCWKRVPICLWTIDSQDTRREPVPPPVSLCAEMVGRQGGGVLLYHDFERETGVVRTYVLSSLTAVLTSQDHARPNYVSLSQL